MYSTQSVGISSLLEPAPYTPTGYFTINGVKVTEYKEIDTSQPTFTIACVFTNAPSTITAVYVSMEEYIPPAYGIDANGQPVQVTPEKLVKRNSFALTKSDNQWVKTITLPTLNHLYYLRDTIHFFDPTKDQGAGAIDFNLHTAIWYSSQGTPYTPQPVPPVQPPGNGGIEPTSTIPSWVIAGIIAGGLAVAAFIFTRKKK